MELKFLRRNDFLKGRQFDFPTWHINGKWGASSQETLSAGDRQWEFFLFH